MDGYVFEETKMRNFAFNQLRSMLFRNPTVNEVESYVYKMKVISLQKHKEKFGIKNSESNPELEVIQENTIVEQEPELENSPEPVKEPTPSPEPVKEPTPSPERFHHTASPASSANVSSPEPFLEPEVNSSSFLQKEDCKKNDHDSLSD